MNSATKVWCSSFGVWACFSTRSCSGFEVAADLGGRCGCSYLGEPRAFGFVLFAFCVIYSCNFHVLSCSVCKLLLGGVCFPLRFSCMHKTCCVLMSSYLGRHCRRRFLCCRFWFSSRDCVFERIYAVWTHAHTYAPYPLAHGRT